MNLEDLNPSSLVRQVDGDAAVEAARSQQSVVEDVGAVRRGDDDHARVPREAVHLRQDLVESLFSLVVGREATTRRSLPANRVDLVDEDDARRVLLRVCEQGANTRRRTSRAGGARTAPLRGAQGRWQTCCAASTRGSAASSQRG